jgi:hypothetical protein
MLFSLCISALLAVWLSEPSERTTDTFRFWGLLLQLLGIGAIVLGLRGKGSQFGEAHIHNSLSKWWMKAPWKRRPVVAHIESVESRAEVGDLAGIVGPRTHASPEERIADLERDLRSLILQASEIRGDLRQELTAVRREMATERSARAQGDRDLGERLQRLAVGGNHIEWAGVWWIGLGLTLATVPDLCAAGWTWLVGRLPA